MFCRIIARTADALMNTASLAVARKLGLVAYANTWSIA